MVSRGRSRRRTGRALLAALLCAALWAPGAARAGSILGLYGGENVGTAGAQFLRIPVGARAVALGRSYVANAYDGVAAFWNPAAIMRTESRRTLFFGHTEYAVDIDLEFASYHWHRQNFGFGLSAGMLRSGEIPRTDEFHQEGTGHTFRADQYQLGFSLARAMTDRFSFGLTGRYYQENLDEFTVRSFLVDLGVLYFVGVGDLRVGFAVRNFGPEMRPDGTPPPIGPGYTASSEFQSFSAPTSGSFGVAYTWRLSRRIDLLTTADFHHPTDYSESFRTGLELGLAERLYLRSGFETNRDEGGLAAGFGVKLARDGWDVRLDYAVNDMGAFGTIHHISLDLAPLHRPRRSP